MRTIIGWTACLGMLISGGGWCDEDVYKEYIELPNPPQDPDCSGCYEKHCKWERCYTKEWQCDTKQQTYESKNCRYIPQYYQKLVCRYVPQYYYETYVRYVPEYYNTYDTYDVPEYKLVKKCKYKPKYYYKKKKQCTSCDEERTEPECQDGSDVE